MITTRHKSAMTKHAGRHMGMRGGIAAILSLLAAACSEQPSAPSSEPAARIKSYDIRFAATVGAEPFACGRSYRGIGLADAVITPQSLLAYVSDVVLVRRDGGTAPLSLTPDGLWQSDSVALLDFEDATGGCNGNPATNTVVRGTAPAAEYQGIRFTLGVPETLNHQDATLADAPLNYTGLFWGWRYGYIFFRLDMETAGGKGAAPAGEAGTRVEASGFSVHLGSVGCGAVEHYTLPPEVPCTAPNRPMIELTGFTPDRDDIVIDLAALLRDADVTVNAAETASGCMSALDDTDCRGLLSKFGLPAYADGPAGAPGAATDSEGVDQPVFRVR